MLCLYIARYRAQPPTKQIEQPNCYQIAFRLVSQAAEGSNPGRRLALSPKHPTNEPLEALILAFIQPLSVWYLLPLFHSADNEGFLVGV